MKIGGQSYVEVGEGVVAEREVVRVVLGVTGEPLPTCSENAVPVREVVTLVAPVDTKRFDDTAIDIHRRLANTHAVLTQLNADIKNQVAKVKEIEDHIGIISDQLETLTAVLKVWTGSWFFRLISWLGGKR